MLRTSLVSLCLASLTAVAAAQGAGDPAAPPPPPDPNAGGAPPPAGAPAPMAMQPPAPAPEMGDNPKGLRNGFSLSVGQEFGTSSAGNGFKGQLYGIDWRIGYQMSKAVGIYLNSHLSLGEVGTTTNNMTGAKGATGNFATALTGEYTLPFRLFVAGGFGYGVLNNPSGPLVGFRVGYYPFEKTDAGVARRLNIAVDTRLYFVEAGGESLTMKHVALTLGYDRF